MCHTEVPSGQATPRLARSEISVELATGEAMPALELPAAGDAPPVLLVADVFGRSPFYEHLAALLAQAGCHVLLPEFFFRQGPLTETGRQAAFARRADLDEAQAVEDLRAAIAWLRSRRSDRAVGVVGFCMGATFVLDLASTEPDLVAISYYGFPVPQPSLVSPPPAPMGLVRGLRGPVLAFWGEQDEAVGMEHVTRYVAEAAAVNPAFEHQILPGLGHGFLGSADLDDPTDPGAATWARTVAHLREHLRQKGA